MGAKVDGITTRAGAPDHTQRKRATLIRMMSGLAKEATTIQHSLSRMVGVCHGACPDESDEGFDHRIRSVTGRVRTLLKGMARLREGLDGLESLHAA